MLTQGKLDGWLFSTNFILYAFAINGDILAYMSQTQLAKKKEQHSKGNIPIFRKSSHTMFSSYSRPGFWYVTLIGISAQSGGNSWPTANPLNAPPQLSIPYVVPKQLWTLNELKAALIRKFPHLSTEEGQGCQR